MKGKLSPIPCLIVSGLSAASLHSALADDRPTLRLPEVLQRHRQALGSRPEPKSERVTGTIETGGVHGTYVTISRGRDKYWSEQKLGLYDEITGSDGKTTWQRDSNGSTRLLSPEEVKNERNDEYVESASFAVPGRLPGKVTLRPETERKTGDYILDIEPEGGKPASLFLDPQTFLVVREQHQDDDLTVTTTFSDFKPINGVVTATTKRVSDGERKYDEVVTITDDQPDIDAPDTLFAMPASPKNYTWVTPTATSATIPFDSSDHNISLFVGINGQPANVILDSGASNLAISKRASDYLKLKTAGTFQARGYGGSTNIYPVKLDSFEIADGVVFHGLTATSLDLHDEYSLFAESTPTVGLLGYPLLSRFVVQVDYRAQHINLFDADTWKPTPADGQPLAVEINDNVPSVLGQFDGLTPGRFLVDTGDAGCVRLYTPFVAQNKIAEKYPRGMNVSGYGVGGESKARLVRAGSFTVAGLTLRNVPTYLSLDAKGGASRVLQGALGHDFLSRFVVTFDYPHGRIFFAPNPDTQKTFDTRTFGILAIRLPDPLVKDKMRIVVYHVDRDSPAHRAGLEDADSIIKIDGQPADVLDLGEVRRLLSPEGGQNTHELSIIGGAGGTGTVKVTMYDPLAEAK